MRWSRMFFPGKVSPRERSGPPRHLGELRSSNPYWGMASHTIATTDWLRPIKSFIRFFKWPIIIIGVVPFGLSYVDPELAEGYLRMLGVVGQARLDALEVMIGWAEAIYASAFPA